MISRTPGTPAPQRTGGKPSLPRGLLLLCCALLLAACVSPASPVASAGDASGTVVPADRSPDEPTMPPEELDRLAWIVAACVLPDSPAVTVASTGAFSEVFLRNVPPADLRNLLARTHRDEGPVIGVRRLHRDGPRGARYEFACARGGVFVVDLRASGGTPPQIDYLRFWRSLPGTADLGKAAQAFGELHGAVSFAAHRLEEDGSTTRIAGHRPEVSRHIASVAKLYVLGALLEEIRAGRRGWEETIRLRDEDRSLPTGIMQRWPAGTPVTVQTLAQLMIEQSDNTATDHLVRLVGRGAVEAAAVRMGHAGTTGDDVHRAGEGGQPAGRLRPFLSTREYFRLQYADGGRFADEFLALRDPVAQTRFLDEVVGALPESRLDSPSGALPRRIGEIGWFASADDLCRALAQFAVADRQAPRDACIEPVLPLLEAAPGTSDPPRIHPYQGFKGGRLPGIAERAHLVRTRAGTWYAVACVWNDGEQDVDEARLIRMVTRVLLLLPE